MKSNPPLTTAQQLDSLTMSERIRYSEPLIEFCHLKSEILPMRSEI